MPGAGWLSAIGLNPTLEAVALQVIVVLLAVVTFVVLERRARHSAASPGKPAQASS